MYTLWNNDAYYVKKYMEQFPSYYCTSDSGYFDAQGYLNIMCRNDDIINTAGHRLSTAAMEEIVISHSAISESAVVGAREEIKGEIPVGFIVIKEGHHIEEEKVTKDLIALVRNQIGAVACFSHIFIVEKLPKTRSGKILRRVLKCMLDGKEFEVPATIEDAGVIPLIQKQVEEKWKVGKDITFIEDVVDKKLKTD